MADERLMDGPSLAARGVGLSEEYVAAVDAALPPAVRLVLWVLREVTRCPDPVQAAGVLQGVVDRALRRAVPGSALPPAMIEQIRGGVVDAVLGERGRVELVGADRCQELSPLAQAGMPPGSILWYRVNSPLPQAGMPPPG